ncbi:MAG TPA: hypothetical protein VK308_11335 [Pyrinomonadaceae bacterium]|nr:hypothetical protein [Pyrinomonadaceae bacterium]
MLTALRRQRLSRGEKRRSAIRIFVGVTTTRKYRDWFDPDEASIPVRSELKEETIETRENDVLTGREITINKFDALGRSKGLAAASRIALITVLIEIASTRLISRMPELFKVIFKIKERIKGWQP